MAVLAMTKINLSVWSFLLGIIVGILIAYGGINIMKEDTQKIIEEWLIYAVSKAEEELGAGKGELKLLSVYNEFISKFPKASRWVTFEDFKTLVDRALTAYEVILKGAKK